MVKGISRRVVVVDSPDQRFFEQAIFIVRNDAAGEGVTARELVEEARRVADEVGYPVLVKASAGGGGRGMRRVDRPEDLPALFQAAQSEAVACFGNGELYVEKLILHPRHIEFQILADSQGNVIHLGERDCSIQRKNQKLIEESPSRALTPQLREEMGQAAVRAARPLRERGYHRIRAV